MHRQVHSISDTLAVVLRSQVEHLLCPDVVHASLLRYQSPQQHQIEFYAAFSSALERGREIHKEKDSENRVDVEISTSPRHQACQTRMSNMMCTFALSCRKMTPFLATVDASFEWLVSRCRIVWILPGEMSALCANSLHVSSIFGQQQFHVLDNLWTRGLRGYFWAFVVFHARLEGAFFLKTPSSFIHVSLVVACPAESITSWSFVRLVPRMIISSWNWNHKMNSLQRLLYNKPQSQRFVHRLTKGGGS